ncbi:MAG: helix-turn-helix domain-containing protein [Deltaproteobacteria bacterium]|nr:helix-turn-helix domain-containing protein [Deltaproteobacteria bacterium]
MSTLGNRIRYIRDDVLRLNQGTFAKQLGFSRIATISDYEKNKRNPDITTLRKIANLGSVTLDWLLTGEEPTTLLPSENTNNGREASSKTIYTAGFVSVEVFPMAEAGSPEVFPACEPIDAISIPRRDYAVSIVAIRTEGDSMTPNVLDGAYVGIDINDKKLISGKLYAVWQNYEGVSIKRVFVYPGCIVLKPDNPAFPETAIPTKNEKPAENFLIGRVKWLYQRY